jgi:hypothetical protein
MSFELFFAFPLLEEDGQGYLVLRWQFDSQLQRHLAAWKQSSPELNEVTIAKKLLLRLPQSPPDELVKRHLIAFLSRFAARATQKLQLDLRRFNALQSDVRAFVQDLFQTAFELALNPVEFFKNFEHNRTHDEFWYFSLKGYISRKMEGQLRDHIRMSEGLTNYGRADLGLAARSSEKRVVEALRYIGESEAEIARLILCWKSFQDARTAKLIQVENPKPEQYRAIAQRYNALRLKRPIPDSQNPTIDEQTAQQWLKTIGAAIRRYCDRRVESLDTIFNLNSETPTIRSEGIADNSTLSEGLDLTKTEIQSESHALTQFLNEKIQALESHQKYILLLKHGLNFNQTQVATELNKDQPFVSRNQTKIQTQLLKQINQWSKTQQGIDLSDRILMEMKAYLIDYLDLYYPQQLQHWIQNAFNRLSQSTQSILRLSATSPLNELVLAQDFMTGVEIQIEAHIQRKLPKQGDISEKITYLIQDWLKSVP